jgi:hypothetical protein
MSHKTPEALRHQAQTLADAAGAALRWFRRPEPAALSAARTARLRARGWRAAAIAELKKSKGPAKSDAADLSFSLSEAVEGAVLAASDAAQWGVGADPEFAAMADWLREGAKALMQAADAQGNKRAEALIQAKRWCAQVERQRRDVREAALESHRFVDSVKRSEIALRLSFAAECLQQACDALAGTLAQ